MKRPGLLCLIIESTQSFPHFHSRHFGSFCNCNMNFITSCLLKFLSCSGEACLLEVQSVSALLLPVNMFLCPYFTKIVRVCFLCEVTCTSPGRELVKSFHNQAAFHKSFAYPPTLPQILTVRQIGFISCQTVCIGKMTRRGHFTLAEK